MIGRRRGVEVRARQDVYVAGCRDTDVGNKHATAKPGGGLQQVCRLGGTESKSDVGRNGTKITPVVSPDPAGKVGSDDDPCAGRKSQKTRAHLTIQSSRQTRAEYGIYEHGRAGCQAEG